MDSLVKLTVKTPNQGFDDVQVNCQMDWTVRKLKEYLQDVYPSKPCSSSQKLIYLGRLLQDHLSLKEVFGDWGARTLHIVCNEPETMATSSTVSTSTTTTVATSTTNSVPAATTTPGADGLRYRGSTSSTQEVPSTQPFVGTPTLPSMYPQYMTSMPYTQPQPTPMAYAQPQATQVQQMQAQLVQQYQQQMQQYYQHMYQWQQTMGSNQWAGNPWPTNQFVPSMLPTPNTPFVTSPGPSLPHTPDSQPQPAQPQQHQQPQPQQQQQQQPEVVVPLNQPNQNVRMNAGPGGAMAMQDEDDDNDNPRNRDWLDWLYTSLRAFMLLSIVYFYSSTSRFIMVTILAFLLYLYQNGWFTPRRVAPPPPVVQEIVEEVQANAENGNEEEEGEARDPEQDNNETNRTEEQPIPNEPPRPNPLRTLCTFCVSFVTSLVPNPPAVGQQ